jgi:hypothetical protein
MAAKIAAPWAVVDGKTIGQWSQEWLKWVVSAPSGAPVADPFGVLPDENPNLSANGSADGGYQTSDKVFFLAGGNWGTPNPKSAAAVGAEPSIKVTAGKDILVPLVNTIDVENNGDPVISSIPDWKGETGGKSYADEARYITTYGNIVVSDAHLSLAKASDPTHPILSLKWPISEVYAADSGVFAINGISASSYVGQLGIPDLPYSDVAGRWAMLTDVPKGDYLINFGGSVGAIQDLFNKNPNVSHQVLPAKSFDVTEVLHVV